MVRDAKESSILDCSHFSYLNFSSGLLLGNLRSIWMSLNLILKLNEDVPTFEFPHIIQILGLLQTHSTITNYSTYVLRCEKSCKWQLH